MMILMLNRLEEAVPSIQHDEQKKCEQLTENAQGVRNTHGLQVSPDNLVTNERAPQLEHMVYRKKAMMYQGHGGR